MELGLKACVVFGYWWCLVCRLLHGGPQNLTAFVLDELAICAVSNAAAGSFDMLREGVAVGSVSRAEAQA